MFFIKNKNTMIYEFLRKNIKIFVLNSSSYENEEKIWI